jgi:HK97 family phage major capsid protein
VQTIPAVGTPTNLDDFADALGLLAEANASDTGAVIVLHPALWAELAILKEDSTDSNKPLLQDSAGSGAQGLTRMIYGAPVFLTSQIDPANAYVYDPSQVVLVRRQDVRVETDSSRLFNSDESEIRAIARVDLVVPNPAAVVILEGIYTVS